MPPNPPKAFLVSQSASNLFCRKKIRLKKVENMPPSFFKFLTTPLIGRFHYFLSIIRIFRFTQICCLGDIIGLNAARIVVVIVVVCVIQLPSK